MVFVMLILDDHDDFRCWNTGHVVEMDTTQQFRLCAFRYRKHTIVLYANALPC